MAKRKNPLVINNDAADATVVLDEPTENKELTAKTRDDLAEGDFALPNRRYPIHDAAHAKNALARVSQYGTPEEKAKVKAAVHKKFPGIGKDEKTENSESTESTLTNNSEEEEISDVSDGTYAELTFNLDMVRVRHERLEGRNYTVCPMVMITEGVHNGSNGPLYYPPEELRKTPAVWNHKPIVVYHPTHNGQGISACEPAVISRRKVGLIMNTKFIPGKGKAAPGKLHAEAWLETERLPAVDDRVALAVKNRQQMEVSTGLFTDNELKEGLWGKERYTAIARNYRPDHLAILPDEKGSCSLADGAGLMRNSVVTNATSMEEHKAAADEHYAQRDKIEAPGRSNLSPEHRALADAHNTAADAHDTAYRTKKMYGNRNQQSIKASARANRLSAAIQKPTGNSVRNAEVSHGEIRDRLHNALRSRPTFPTGLASENAKDVPWVRDVFKTFCIYTSGNDTYKHDYEVGKAGEVKLKGNPQKVTSRQTYSTDDGKTINSEGVLAMDKDQLIEALIDNAESPFTEEDRDTLNSFDEDKLEAIANKVGCGDTVTGPEGPNAKQVKGAKKFVKPKKQGSKSGVETKNADKDDDEEDDTTDNAENAEMTEDAYINAAPPGIRESLIHNRNLLQAEKAKLVGVIMNNAAGVKFNKAALQSKSVDELQALAALAGGPTRNQRREQPQSLLQNNNYAGMADAGGTGFTANDEATAEPPLVSPTLNFSRNS